MCLILFSKNHIVEVCLFVKLNCIFHEHGFVKYTRRWLHPNNWKQFSLPCESQKDFWISNLILSSGLQNTDCYQNNVKTKHLKINNCIIDQWRKLYVLTITANLVLVSKWLLLVCKLFILFRIFVETWAMF